jgi:hypothetical protein
MCGEGVLRLLPFVITVAAAVGCSSPPQPPSKVVIRVLDEAKAPVAGAELSANAQTLTTTGADGSADVMVTGREGTTFAVDVRCPNTYRSPSAPVLVRRLRVGSAQAPEYVTTCSRLRHSLAVTIRAEGGADMPILHLGKEVARTDQTGMAHVMIEGLVHERVDLTIDSSDPKFAKLHPQSPVVSFSIPDKDDAQTYLMKFMSPPKPVRHVAARTGPKAF